MKNKSNLKSWIYKILGTAGLITAIYLSAPKLANAQTGSGFVGENFGNSEVSITNGTDTTSCVASILVPRKHAYYWSCPLPNSTVGDTLPVWAIDTLENRADTWLEVTGTGPHNVITLYPGGYTGTIRNVENCADTLVSANLVVKHGNSYSDTLVDTFFIDSPYHDIYFNLGESDSVQAWTNGGDWDQLFGDSVFVSANAINYNEVGSSEGIIERYWIDGDQLPDMVMETGVHENKLENKVYSQNLLAKPSIGSRFEISNDAYIGKKKELRIYSGIGGLVRVINSNSGKWNWDGKDDKGNDLPKGVYFGVVDTKRTKLVKPE